jgi:RHS repeat-associated protein
VGKSIDGVAVQAFVYQDQLNPIAEYDGSGALVSVFVYAERGHVPSFMRKGGNTYRIVADHLGSVRQVIDVATGVVVQRLDYDEYGVVLTDSNPGFQPFGYAGGIYDRDTGLVRFGARDYDAISGRWTAKDPIGFAGGQANVFVYTGGNPVDLIDSNGNRAYLAFHGVGGGRYHGKIVIYPDNQAKWQNHPQFKENGFATFGGGPDGMWKMFGPLNGGVNRPFDVSKPNAECHELSGMHGLSEDELIQRLLDLTELYQSGARPNYTLLPFAPSEYNSNSYVHGLGLAAGFWMPFADHIRVNAPGYNQPLPRFYFGP